MWQDTRAQFCDSTLLNTGGAGNYLIGDVIDLAVASHDIGTGAHPLHLVVTIPVTAGSSGSATAQFSLLTDDNGSMSSPTVLASSAVIPVANMAAGTVAWIFTLPPRFAAERFLGFRQTTGTAAFNAGRVNAFFTTDVSAWRSYQNGVTT